MGDISLKEYLDEKFLDINKKLAGLDQAGREEHDIIISLSNDISHQYDEIKELKLNAIACKEYCNRRKDDFDKNVRKIAGPMVDSATLRIKIWAATSILIVLAAATAYVVKDFIMAPVKTHIEGR